MASKESMEITSPQAITIKGEIDLGLVSSRGQILQRPYVPNKKQKPHALDVLALRFFFNSVWFIYNLFCEKAVNGAADKKKTT